MADVADEIGRLQDRVDQLEMLVATLRQQLRDRDQTIQQLRDDNERLRQENEQLRQQLDDALRAQARQAAPFRRPEDKKKADADKKRHHAPNNPAKLGILLETVISRERLRATYGEGFHGRLRESG